MGVGTVVDARHVRSHEDLECDSTRRRQESRVRHIAWMSMGGVVALLYQHFVRSQIVGGRPQARPYVARLQDDRGFDCSR